MIIEITSVRLTLDWFDYDKHKIDTEKILGFEIHWRIQSWHVVVVEKPNSNGYCYRIDLQHSVSMEEVAKLIANPHARIKEIKNYHNHTDFVENLSKLMDRVKILQNDRT